MVGAARSVSLPSRTPFAAVPEVGPAEEYRRRQSRQRTGPDAPRYRVWAVRRLQTFFHSARIDRRPVASGGAVPEKIGHVTVGKFRPLLLQFVRHTANRDDRGLGISHPNSLAGMRIEELDQMLVLDIITCDGSAAPCCRSTPTARYSRRRGIEVSSRCGAPVSPDVSSVARRCA